MGRTGHSHPLYSRRKSSLVITVLIVRGPGCVLLLPLWWGGLVSATWSHALANHIKVISNGEVVSPYSVMTHWIFGVRSHVRSILGSPGTQRERAGGSEEGLCFSWECLHEVLSIRSHWSLCRAIFLSVPCCYVCAQSWLTLWDPIDCSPPGSFV